MYIDNHVLALCKPAGMPCCPDASGDPDLLTAGKDYIKRRFQKPSNVYLGLVHRLDRPTSGVMLFARTSKASSRLSRAFRERSVRKRYLAIVRGRLTGSSSAADTLVQAPGASRVEIGSEYAGERGSKSANLTYEAMGTVSVASGKKPVDVSLVGIELGTGRKHQIRAQMANMGHPIVGDIKYGGRHNVWPGSLTPQLHGNAIVRQIALHSTCIEAPHPVSTSDDIAVSCAPPDEWSALFSRSLAVNESRGVRGTSEEEEEALCGDPLRSAALALFASAGNAADARNTWRVVRQDDNGNQFTVETGLSEAAARAVEAEFEERGHKQGYWAEMERNE